MRRLILFLLVFSFLASATASFGAVVYEFYLRTPMAGAKQREIVISVGSGVKTIGDELLASGMIKSSFLFETYVLMVGADRSFQAGSHMLAPGLSMRALTRALTAGGGRRENTITIIEGWTLRDIKKYLVSQNVKAASEFDRLAGRSSVIGGSSRDWSAEFAFLKDAPADASLEGYLFPDTYRIFAESTAEDVIRKMLQNFDRKFSAELRAEAQKKKMSIFDVVTLASIIEREVREEEDMQKVADIFLRRMRLGIALQADSTVNYVTGKDTPAISYDDRGIKSPWNTYKYRGLPKGPISNPGLPALRAVLAPMANPYLYFLTTKEGEVIYSLTIEEHNRAKAKYLK